MGKHKGRPNRGRTQTLKQRAVYLYVPTEKMLAKWKKEAEHFGMPLSGFLVEVVDDAMRRSPSGLTPREKIEKELGEATAQLDVIRKNRDSLASLLKQSEATVARYRESLEDVVSQVPDEKYEQRVVSLFLKRGFWQVDELAKELGVDALKSEETNRLLGEVDHLKRVGLVEGDFGEWRWLGGVKRRPRIPPEVRRKHRSLHKRIPARLRASRDDSGVGSIVRIEPE